MSMHMTSTRIMRTLRRRTLRLHALMTVQARK
jgi:hypothetical protein